MKGGWFVTGTDTGVGKTCVTEALLKALGRRGARAVGMKPVASGGTRTPEGFRVEDVARLAAASSVSVRDSDINAYAFEPAIAPHIAAAKAGVTMGFDAIEQQFSGLAARADWIVVEGAGGWDVPFDRTHTLADVARLLGLPVILVVGVRLGCINHALLTARAVRSDGQSLAGWVANRIDPTFDTANETIETLEARLGAPCLARVPFEPDPLAWQRCGETMLTRLLPANA